MLVLAAMMNKANVITAGVKSDKIVTVTLKPLAARQNHAVADYDSFGTP